MSSLDYGTGTDLFDSAEFVHEWQFESDTLFEEEKSYDYA